MRIHSAGVLSAALVAGMAGSVAAYRSQIAEAPAVETTTAVVRAPQPVKQSIRFRWAPCPKGSQLEEGVCVTDLVRTVVVPAAPVNVPAPVSAGGAATNGHEDDGDVGYDDRDEDEQGEHDQDEHDQDEHDQDEHDQDEDDQDEDDQDEDDD